MICVICGNETEEYCFSEDLIIGGIEINIVAAAAQELCEPCLAQAVQSAIEQRTKG